MLISSLHAQAAPQAGGFDPMQFLPLIFVFAIFYFLMIRPQQKRAKEHKEMINNIRRGDRVLTAGGIIGTVSSVTSDTELEVEIAKDTVVRVARGTVSQVMDKTMPIAKNDSADKPKKKTPARKPAAKKTAAKKTVTK